MFNQTGSQEAFTRHLPSHTPSRISTDSDQKTNLLRHAQPGPPSPPQSPGRSATPHASTNSYPSASTLTPPSNEPSIMDPPSTVPSQDHEGDSLKSKTTFPDSQRSVSLKRKIEEDVSIDESPQKRPRNDPEPPPAPLFEWNDEPVPVAQPDVTQDLVKLYNLESTASKYYRRNEQGEKTNKLRKSYAGKVKDLPGNPETEKRPGELFNIMEAREEDFNNLRRTGKDVANGLPDSYIAKLDRALTLQPGKFPKAEDSSWKKYLAIDDMTKATNPAQPFSQPARPQLSAAQSTTAKVSSPNPSNPRSMRKGVKRRYDDGSFEGYPEAYGDDSDTPLSELHDEDGQARRKSRARKDFNDGSRTVSGNVRHYSGSPPVSLTSGGGGYPQR